MLIFIAVLSIFLIGFVLGKYYGKRQGLQEGAAVAKLEMRQQSLETGYCVVCHSTENQSTFGRCDMMEN